MAGLLSCPRVGERIPEPVLGSAVVLDSWDLSDHSIISEAQRLTGQVGAAAPLPCSGCPTPKKSCAVSRPRIDGAIRSVRGK